MTLSRRLWRLRGWLVVTLTDADSRAIYLKEKSELIDKKASNVPTRHTSSRLDTNMSAFTLSTSVLRPRASVGLSSRRRRTRSAVRAAGRESSDSFEAFDTSEIEALLASTTEAREEIEEVCAA